MIAKVFEVLPYIIAESLMKYTCYEVLASERPHMIYKSSNRNGQQGVPGGLCISEGLINHQKVSEVLLTRYCTVIRPNETADVKEPSKKIRQLTHSDFSQKKPASYEVFCPSTRSIFSCTSLTVNLCMSFTAFPAESASSSPSSALLTWIYLISVLIYPQ